MLNKDELLFAKQNLDFWENLNSNQRTLAEDNLTKITYLKGSNLHSSEHECLGVLLIHTGELRVYILSEDGREVTLYRLYSGEVCVLSASCILNHITFDVHIDAETDTEVLLLNINAFRSLCKQNVYVENFAYKKTVDRFSDVMQAMEQILFLSFDKRLAIFLSEEMIKTNSTELKITQEQIAKYIGSAREVVSRMLKVFQAQGILEQSRGYIRIIDQEKLEELL